MPKPKFYVLDPMTQVAPSEKFDDFQEAVEFARQLQWRNRSFSVEVLAVAAKVQPKSDPADTVVTSDFKTALLPAPAEEEE